MKKAISLVLALSMIFCTTVSAASNIPVVIEGEDMTIELQESAEELVVIVDHTDYYEVATRVAGSDIITSETYDTNNQLLESFTIDLSTLPAPADYYQHTLSNYEYDVDSSDRHEVWTCRREDDYKTRTRYSGSVTEERLLHWQEEVEDINSLEKDIIFSAGKTLASACINAALKGQIAAAIAMVGGSMEMANCINDLAETWDDADAVFDKL